MKISNRSSWFLGMAVVAAAFFAGAAPSTPPAATRPTITPPSSGGAFSQAPATKPADPSKLDAKGYIRQWLMLAPINFGEKYDAQDIDKPQIPNEAKLMPKAGDKIKVKSVEKVGDATQTIDKEFTWQKVVTPEYFIDFNAELKLDSSESVGGYAVCYLDAPEEMKGITFSLSTNDDGVIYLNGKSIFSYVGGRGLSEDSDTVEGLTLNKGTNVVIFKVWNDSANWQGCIRLLDKEGKPVSKVTVKLTP